MKVGGNAASIRPRHTLLTSLTQRLTGKRSGKGGFSNFSKNLVIFKPRRSRRHLQDHFTRLMMTSESCSASSSPSDDDFVPIFFFFLLRKVMNSFRRIYDKWSTIRWMKQTQLQLKLSLSSMKTKGIQTWTCGRQVGNTFWCQCGQCVAKDRRQDCVCCFDYVECVKKVRPASKDCT